jgi:hypothetical protein
MAEPKRRKLSGFKLPAGVKKWSDPATVSPLTLYLEANSMRLELDKSPPQSSWNKRTKLALTCLQCGYPNKSTCIANLQQGQGISCMCGGGKDVLTTQEYYEKAIKKPFTDRNEKLWYPRLHDGSTQPVPWETWLPAAALGALKGKLPLTCTYCGVPNDTTSIANLQRGQGMSCMCGGGKDVLTNPEYYETAIKKPFIDRNGKLWYARLHDGSIEPVPWETWLPAAAQGNDAKIKLTCSYCRITNESTSISTLQQGKGMSCVCSNGILTASWYYEKAIQKRFIDRNGKLWYARLHDGSTQPVPWETWLPAAAVGHNGKLKLTCTHCGVTNETTSITNLQGGQGMSCNCTMSSSQRKILTWLQENNPEYMWESEIRDCKRNNVALPFDIACRALGLLLENDGDQHFEIDGFFVPTQDDLDQRARTDLYKEQWALENGFAVARLVWSDVLYDLNDWQGFLRNVIEERKANVQVKVYTPEWSPQYSSGIYHTLRQQVL